MHLVKEYCIFSWLGYTVRITFQQCILKIVSHLFQQLFNGADLSFYSISGLSRRFLYIRGQKCINARYAHHDATRIHAGNSAKIYMVSLLWHDVLHREQLYSRLHIGYLLSGSTSTSGGQPAWMWFTLFCDCHCYGEVDRPASIALQHCFLYEQSNNVQFLFV